MAGAADDEPLTTMFWYIRCADAVPAFLADNKTLGCVRVKVRLDLVAFPCGY